MIHRGKVTRVKAGRLWVRLPDVAGQQEFGGAKGFQYVDPTRLAAPVVTDGGDYAPVPHTHTVTRAPYAVGDAVLVAAVGGRLTDLVVLGLLKP